MASPISHDYTVMVEYEIPHLARRSFLALGLGVAAGGIAHRLAGRSGLGSWLDQRWSTPPSRISRKRPNELVIELETGEQFQTNETGAFVWIRFDGLHTGEQICRALAEESGISWRRARRDLEVFVSRMAQLGLVQPA